MLAQKVSSREEISNLKKCLDQIIYFYKDKVSGYIKKDEMFTTKLKSIEKLIMKFKKAKIKTIIKPE